MSLATVLSPTFVAIFESEEYNAEHKGKLQCALILRIRSGANQIVRQYLNNVITRNKNRIPWRHTITG
jgi:hypothetical protein